MKLSTLVFVVIVGFISAFSIANWRVIMAPTDLSLFVTSVQAPLGLILLGTVLSVTVFFLAFVVYLQTSVLLEARRHARELGAQRQLADQAEASRFTELRTYLDGQLLSLGSRIDRGQSELEASVVETGNSLAAYIGEVEDRLIRMGGEDPGQQS